MHCIYRLHSFATVAYFFFNDTATTEIYTLSLHDALPISGHRGPKGQKDMHVPVATTIFLDRDNKVFEKDRRRHRSEEHTSELQSRVDLVCRLLLEKKKKERVYLNST